MKTTILATTILVLSCGTVATAGKPNVLFVVCDDLNDRVSTAGYPHIKTPAFDKLAATGMVFRRAYCQYPVCGPSRASFLTGIYPQSTGVLDNKTDIRTVRPGTISLPEHFKRNGYWTAGVGKVFHGKLDQGKTAWHDYHKFQNTRNPVIEPVKKAFEKKHGSIDKPANRKKWRQTLRSIRKKSAGQTPPGYGPTDMTDAEHKDGKNVRQVAAWLNKRAFGDKPFFIACGIHKPHVPFWAPKKYFAMYPKPSLKLKTPPADDWKDIPQIALVKRYLAFGFQPAKTNDALARNYVQAYHACISFVDAQLGLLWATLEQNGLAKNTIVVLISDHGYHLGEHFLWGKVTLFEECARVPMVVRVPGRTKAGSQTSALVELADLYPTLAELTKTPVGNKIQGRSFVGVLDDPKRYGRDTAYTVVTRGKSLGRSIRTKRWRYAEWGSAEQNELYDLSKDPSEHRNLARNADYQKVVADLRAKLRAREKQATALHPSKTRK